MDIFEEYIQKNKCDENCRALICSSYKKVYEQEHRKKPEPIQTNDELATYGDALLKFALCHKFLNNVPNITETKKEYEEDKFLIEVIAKHYSLLDYMNFNSKDEKSHRNINLIKKVRKI